MAKRSAARDLHPEVIKARVRMRGWTLTAVSRAYGLPEHACRHALRYPYYAAEYAIADVLGLSPRQIWPSRYRPDGSRPWPTRGTKATPRRIAATTQNGAAA